MIPRMVLKSLKKQAKFLLDFCPDVECFSWIVVVMMRMSEGFELIESFFDRCNSNSQKSSGDRNAPSSEDTSSERERSVLVMMPSRDKILIFLLFMFKKRYSSF